MKKMIMVVLVLLVLVAGVSAYDGKVLYRGGITEEGRRNCAGMIGELEAYMGAEVNSIVCYGKLGPRHCKTHTIYENGVVSVITEECTRVAGEAKVKGREFAIFGLNTPEYDWFVRVGFHEACHVVNQEFDEAATRKCEEEQYYAWLSKKDSDSY